MKKIILLLFFVKYLLQCEPFSKSDSMNYKKDSIETKSKWQIGLRLDYNSVMETTLLKYDIQPD